MKVWNSSRATTSKMIERRSGASVRPASRNGSASGREVNRRATSSWRVFACGECAAESAPRTTFSCWVSSSWRSLRKRSPRPLTKIRDAMPVAATVSTVISPMVSHARMSTSRTLTTLAPSPIS